MGCSLSHHKFFKSNKDDKQDIFKVYNVNDAGHNCYSGKIELTSSSLIHHQQDKHPISWPLTCLRRYGYQEDLFTFESGRSCATGSGIFAFRSAHADKVFNRLQHYLTFNTSEARNIETHLNHNSDTINQPSAINQPSTNSSFLHPNRAIISLNDYHNLMMNPLFHHSNDSSPLSVNSPSVYENQPCLTLASLPDLLANPITAANYNLHHSNILSESCLNSDLRESNTYLNIANTSPHSAVSSPTEHTYIYDDQINYTRIFFPEDNGSLSYLNEKEAFKRPNTERSWSGVSTKASVEDANDDSSVLKYTTIDIDKTTALNHMSNYTHSKRNRQTSP